MGGTAGTAEGPGYRTEAIVTGRECVQLLEHPRLCTPTRAVGQAGDQALRSTWGHREKQMELRERGVASQKLWPRWALQR